MHIPLLQLIIDGCHHQGVARNPVPSHVLYITQLVLNIQRPTTNNQEESVTSPHYSLLPVRQLFNIY